MATINYKANKRQDGSYIYAEAVTTNRISYDELCKKVSADSKFSKFEVMDVLSKAFAQVQKEVCEGNRVELPSEDGLALSAYPIIDGSVIHQGDKDSDNQLIPVTVESLTNRASQWKVKMGFQAAINYADITRQAHLQFNGDLTTIKNSTTTPTTPSGTTDDEDERGV